MHGTSNGGQICMLCRERKQFTAKTLGCWLCSCLWKLWHATCFVFLFIPPLSIILKKKDQVSKFGVEFSVHNCKLCFYTASAMKCVVSVAEKSVHLWNRVVKKHHYCFCLLGENVQKSRLLNSISVVSLDSLCCSQFVIVFVSILDTAASVVYSFAFPPVWHH